MEKERNEEEVRLYDLNKRFLAEVEKGAEWVEVKYIIEEMKEVAKELDHVPVITMDNPAVNNERAPAKGLR
jgi:hypothetical protein